MFKFIALFIFILASLPGWTIEKNSMLPPIDKEFRVRVDFWKKVYTEITSQQGFIHDKWKPAVIYKKVDFKTRHSRKKSRISKREVRKIKSILRKIIRKNLKNLNSEESKYLKLSQAKNKKELRSAIRNIRTQYGLKDNYFIGLQKSHRYLDYIKSVFKSYGLPKELVYLPHVESSFNYRAYSKVGAAGIWQFMRSTARLYKMKINYVIDERRDPLIATVAAAKLLKYNFQKIQAWPLAVTAYNHGLRSIQRAVAKVGSKKISKIIANYKGRRFGFASKNFYATFIATVEISQNPQKYFPSFKKPARFTYSSISLTKPLTVKQIKNALDLDIKTIKLYNPSIRSIAYRSSLQLPKNFNLQVPAVDKKTKAEYLAKLNSVKSLTKNLRVAAIHKIRRGDSLYTLSKIYRISIHDLIVFNQISNPSRIYPGMKIKIPGSKELKELKTQTVAKIKKAPPVKVAEVKVKKPIKEEIKPKEKSWLNNLISWNSKKAESSIETEEAEEDRIEDKSTDIASKLVSLDNYELNLKNLSGDLYEIVIETDETLGHYADWSLTRLSKIKRENRMRRNSIIRMGQRLKLRLTEETKKRFISERAEYHLSIQEDFYQSFQINGVENYSVKRGDNLDQILSSNDVPLWLFRQYQDKSFNINSSLNVGKVFKIPQVDKRVN